MKNQILSVLANRQFLFLWIAEIFSQISFNMINFILIILAFKLSNSNTAVSGIVLSFTIPAIMFGLPAGAFVDRWDKKFVLFGTNAVRALLLVFLVFFHSDLLLIYILSFLIAVVTQFFIPAETPVIPLIVKKESLLPANALFGMGIYGSSLIAYAISGPSLIFFGSTYIFIFLSILFLLAAFFISLIKIPKDKKDEMPVKPEHLKLNLVGEIKTAFLFLAKTREIYQSLFLLTLSQVLILILAVIGPGFAKEVLGISVDEFPLFFVTPAALGMVIGAIIIGNFFHNSPRKKMADTGVMLGGIFLLLLPYGSKVASRDFIQTINNYLPNLLTIDILHIVVFLAFALGFANALIFVPSNTILQEETSDEQRGKIYGVLNALVGVFSLFPIIVVGELADIFGVSYVLTGLGVGLLMLSVVRVIFKQ